MGPVRFLAKLFVVFFIVGLTTLLLFNNLQAYTRDYTQKENDEFIGLADKISEGGVIYYSLTNGVYAIEASFVSSKKPSEIVDTYNNYLKKKGVNSKLESLSDALRKLQDNPGIIKNIKSGQACQDCQKYADEELKDRGPVDFKAVMQDTGEKFQEGVRLWREIGNREIPVWLWSGMIGNEEKMVFISPAYQENYSVKVVSYKKNFSLPKGLRLISDECPEFSNLSGTPLSSRQTIGAGNCGALFTYNAWGAPKQAIELAVKRLKQTGWIIQAQGPNLEDGGSIAILRKKSLNLFLSAVRDKGQTSLLAAVDLINKNDKGLR